MFPSILGIRRGRFHLGPPLPLHPFCLYSLTSLPASEEQRQEERYPPCPGNATSPGVGLLIDFWVTWINLNCLSALGEGAWSKQSSYPNRKQQKQQSQPAFNFSQSSFLPAELQGQGVGGEGGWERKQQAAVHPQLPRRLLCGAEGGLTPAEPGIRRWGVGGTSWSCLRQRYEQTGLLLPCQAWSTGRPLLPDLGGQRTPGI